RASWLPWRLSLLCCPAASPPALDSPSLHDALPIFTRMTSDINLVQRGLNMFLRLFLRSPFVVVGAMVCAFAVNARAAMIFVVTINRKSTRLNSSHVSISYAVFCLKKKTDTRYILIH